MKLADIARIKSGAVFTKKPIASDHGSFYVLDGSSVAGDNVLTSKMTKVDVNQPGIKVPLKESMSGDILLRSKGVNRTALVFDWPNQDLPVFPSSLFHMISIYDTRKFDPNFIAVVINSKSIQSYLSNNATGSTVSYFPLSVTKEIEIPEISMDKQMKIVQLNKAFKRQLHLMQELSTVKLNFQTSCINEEVWGGK